MSSPVSRGAVSAERFEQIYAAREDPWDYESSAYEQAKYAHTLAAIGDGPFARALEIGCSIGVFTAQLAPRCGDLVAVDFSDRALARARRRLLRYPRVNLARVEFPHQTPSGPFDLIICSEVLYYLDAPARDQAIDWFASQLVAGALLVAVSWRGTGDEEPATGDAVHDQLIERLAPWHDADERRPGYRLDRFGRR